jgi:hypothetical protein
MTRIDIIRLDEIEPYMEFLRREVTVVRILQELEAMTKRKLEIIEQCKHEARRLLDIRRLHGFKFKSHKDAEFIAQVRRLAK